MKIKNNLHIFYLGLLHTITTVFAIIFEEWLFTITKPSAFYLYTNLEIIWSLFIISGFFILVFLACYCFIGALLVFFERPLLIVSSVFLAILSISAIILIFDNTTTTLWSWGIKDCKLIGGIVYLCILIFFGIELYRAFYKNISLSEIRSWFHIFSSSIFILSLICLGLAIVKSNTNNFILSENGLSTKNMNLPNILLFSADGVNADNLKLYGYQNQTTPFLDDLAKNALLVENVSTNATITFSSLLSILTGRHPATTKTFYPPHILTGNSTYAHLPSILRKYGYKNLQITTEYHADAFHSNLRSGFDLVNDKKEDSLIRDRFFFKYLPLEGLFVDELIIKLKLRYLHLLRIKRIKDHFTEVNSNLKLNSADRERINKTLDFLKGTTKPFFAQVHLLSTHCCNYKSPENIFSNSYDNAIYYTDRLFGEIIELLKRQNKLNNTIIVYSSDHTDRWGVIKRIPLIFMFPNNKAFTIRKNNAQLLDIAPTLLDYLGIQKPIWMEGVSLLNSEPPINRPIFSFGSYDRTNKRMSVKTALSPYGIESYVVKLCQNWYKYDLIKKKLTSGITPNHSNHSNNCLISNLKNEKLKALALIKEHLYNRGLKLEHDE